MKTKQNKGRKWEKFCHCLISASLPGMQPAPKELKQLHPRQQPDLQDESRILSGKIQILIFDTDTLTHYSCDEIRADNKILIYRNAR